MDYDRKREKGISILCSLNQNTISIYFLVNKSEVGAKLIILWPIYQQHRGKIKKKALVKSQLFFVWLRFLFFFFTTKLISTFLFSVLFSTLFPIHFFHNLFLLKVVKIQQGCKTYTKTQGQRCKKLLCCYQNSRKRDFYKTRGKIKKSCSCL